VQSTSTSRKAHVPRFLSLLKPILAECSVLHRESLEEDVEDESEGRRNHSGVTLGLGRLGVTYESWKISGREFSQ
jgi:hypothetical protein